MNQPAQWNDCRSMLCVRLDNAGDLLMTTPAIRSLKAAIPGRRISLLCSSAGALVGSLIPDCVEIIIYDAPWIKATPPRADVSVDTGILKSIAGKKFDGAVIFTVYSQNPLPAAMLCYLAGVPLRAAFCRENPYQLLTHWLPDPEPGSLTRHEVERQLALASSIGGAAGGDRIKITIPERAVRSARLLLAKRGIAPGVEWITIHPGASAPSRMYPAESFSRAARLLSTRFKLVFTGSRAETGLIESIREGIRERSCSLAGMTDMEEFAALISISPLVISNNTCAVHLASATATPVVDLYALTNPQHTPWKTPNRVLSADVDCKYCYKSVCPRGSNDCLALVPPEEVVTAACGLLEESRCTHSG